MPQIIGSTTNGTTQAFAQSYIAIAKFVASATGTMEQLRINSFGGSNVKLAVYADNGSGTDAGTRLWVNNTGVYLAAGWNSFWVSPGLSITSGTTYWIGCNLEAADRVNYDSTGGTIAYKVADYTTVGCPADASGGVGAAYNFAMQGWSMVGRNNAMMF